LQRDETIAGQNVRLTRSIIIVTDISRRADPAATAAIWYLRGVNWYLERYYAITMYTCARECKRERNETAEKLLSAKLRASSARTMLVYFGFVASG